MTLPKLYTKSCESAYALFNFFPWELGPDPLWDSVSLRVPCSVLSLKCLCQVKMLHLQGMQTRSCSDLAQRLTHSIPAWSACHRGARALPWAWNKSPFPKQSPVNLQPVSRPATWKHDVTRAFVSDTLSLLRRVRLSAL